MAIKPKYIFSGTAADTSQKTEKKFTDREPFLEAFYNALSTKIKDEQKILMFYGVGGIGKTSLRKELCKRLETEKSNTVWSVIDFDNPPDREEETALFLLRNHINKKYCINFPLFDIAYTILWQKTHPQIPMTPENFSLLDGENVVTEIIRLVGEIPQIGFVPKLTNAFVTGENVYKKWWERKGKKELMNLPSMEPKDITARLPMYFATDLKDYLKENKKEAVLFLDTYEALWETIKTDIGFFERDEWVRELISQLPEVIWVITGREKLRWQEQDEEWNKYIEQHLLGSLSEGDSAYFLRTCGIENTEVQNVIITASKGVPYFLDLAVDTYYEIKNRHKTEPATEDFAKTQNDVLERFLKYLDYSEIETLKTLSVARVWSGDIFRLLVKKFRTGYPLTEMNNIFRFSFISETGKQGNYVMHDLMSEELRLTLEQDKLKLIHKALFEYYDEKLKSVEIKNIDENAKQNLIEACYHGKVGLEFGNYYEWFSNVSKMFFKVAQYLLLLSLYEDFLKTMGASNKNGTIEYANILHENAIIYFKLGKYKDAETLFRQALKKKRVLLGNKHIEVGKIINDLAGLISQQGNYTESEKMYISSIEIIENISGKECIEITHALNNLAIIYSIRGKYSDAELLFNRTLKIKEKLLGPKHTEVALTLCNLANINLDLKKFNRALDLYFRTLSIYENTFGKYHPDVGKTLAGLGNAYLLQEKYEEAVSYYKEAKNIIESTLGQEHPEVAIIIYNLAFLYTKLSKYDEAYFFNIEAIKQFRKYFGKNHPNTASSINNLGILFLQKKRFREAEIMLKSALKIRIETLGEEQIDLSDSYKDFAKLYEEQNRISEAIEYLEKAKNILEKILGKENSEIIKLSEKINKLKNKYL